AKNEGRTVNGKWQIGNGKRQTANGNGHWQTVSGELGMVHGEWQMVTSNGKDRQRQDGKESTTNGKWQKANWKMANGKQ
ncbi:hypothetical protein PAXRUDRAFT_179614, partial [Paxillus rubicundulus Ve08.2h10]